ncbi:cold shock domain-containing protein, partial [bacterium]|nr:cold shock domain-containing protein [bacterium]
RLSEKISKLEKFGILKGRILNDVQTIRYHGNDASHRLDGTRSDADSILDKCKKFNEWFIQYKELLIKTTSIPQNGFLTGVIDSINGNKITVRDKESLKLFNFDISKYPKPLRVKVDDDIVFELENNQIKDIRFLGVISLTSENDNGKFAFVSYRGETLYFSYGFIKNIETLDQIKKGIKVSFLASKNSMKGKNDEIFELNIAETRAGKISQGKIKSFDNSRKFAFISENFTNEEILFNCEESSINLERLDVNDDVIFEIYEEKLKFKARNIKWIGKIQNTNQHPKKGKYGFIRTTNKNEDIFFTFNLINESFHEDLKEGKKVSFTIKPIHEEGQKDEAHDVMIID